MNTLIVSIKLIAKGNIPSQVELLGKPIYENGILKSFETLYQDYNYDEENNLDFSIENFNMTVDEHPEFTYEFTNYFTFNVLSEGEAEFEFCVLIKDVHDDLINIIDNLITPVNIKICDFKFKDDCYCFNFNMEVSTITNVEILDIH
ncbi:hypothetical protein ACQKNX_08235 [Lysinibacillus sp. NPDC093712]|uniref:hypothetical protein n=1 Tax=Lysinibacillus sp. NPDC093712 TaxID=3390579 RepID=UPI003D05A28A